MYLPALLGHVVRHSCKQTRFFFQIMFWQTPPQRMVSMLSNTVYIINWNTVVLFTHKIVTYITHVLSIVEGEKGILQCSCENTYACVNNTCWGRICFYSSVHERVVRGCFPPASSAMCLIYLDCIPSAASHTSAMQTSVCLKKQVSHLKKKKKTFLAQKTVTSFTVNRD